ncbi:MAG: hypothetical protein AAGI38_15650 [Bacteroidota bacterium]
MYYRLKQVDLDGQFEFSKMVELKPASPATTMDVMVYPNPLKDQGTIKVVLPEAGSV